MTYFYRSDRQRLGQRFDQKVEIKIRRSNIVQDGYAELNALGAAMKGRLYIQFINQ